ncbi:hypothetical protein [Streptomyces chromofuscus]|uniref:Uncharacterized protein n=1 Tax=Streptomyces chromofuscus TaxID=42881 RepID=A0A7M2T916_STRCW|nr:hypothetical protein [Streptomyces chromofuscus]QOV45150.1 hypothetical protein IPT68_04030 [Streptomyces chromofuscus]GGT33338.1 hypothetical protein GCM10010254_62060 [Streptomyces chromofuscus]
MVSGTHTAHTIEITAESLQKDLARLEVQKQALERELAAVVAHLGSVQRALSAIEVLMTDASGAAPAVARSAAAADEDQPSPPAEPRSEESAPVSEDHGARAGRGVRQSDTPQDAQGPADSEAATDADGQRKYGALTEQILDYFATAGNADVRARDVAAALGRDTDSGSINAVRSTLDRLVGTSRIRRTGRGLYRAKRS